MITIIGPKRRENTAVSMSLEQRETPRDESFLDLESDVVHAAGHAVAVVIDRVPLDAVHSRKLVAVPENGHKPTCHVVHLDAGCERPG